MDVRGIRGEHFVPRPVLSRQGYECVEHVRGPGPAEKLASTTGEMSIGHDQLRSRQHLGQASLAGTSSPRLGNHGSGQHGPLSHPVDFGEQCPGVAVSPVKRNERSCIEHPHAAGGFRRRAVACHVVRALAAAMSFSVMGPASVSYSAMAAANCSRARRSAAAWAIQALTPPRPARRRTSSTRSPGRVTVSRGISRSILEYDTSHNFGTAERLAFTLRGSGRSDARPARTAGGWGTEWHILLRDPQRCEQGWFG